MNLKQFATLAGVKIVRCDKNEWGGEFAYKLKDKPACTVCGYKNEDALLNGWLVGYFGKRPAKAILKLLKETEIKEF